jgi:hypothetical protein
MNGTSQSLRVSRRRFGLVAAGAALPLLGRQRPQLNAQQPDYVPPQRALVPDVPPFAGTLQFTPGHVAPKAVPFPMSQVRLLPRSVFHDALEWNRADT